jgi:D-tagatose-1,6-bisphosphate aldolase subunit GatZ/KbaZ
MPPTHVLTELVQAQQRGEARGIPSICSAHPLVVEAALRHAQAHGGPVLIEATCNQVNQEGGYTGMTAPDFVAFVHAIADACGFPHDWILLGGDHLGPNPWRTEPAAAAMQKACVLVQSFVRAGFTKIHLDASMKCADDPAGPLAAAVAAGRAALLARAAEEALAGDGVHPCYVIGTEVPVPGGVQGNEEAVEVSRPEDVAETIELTRRAFAEQGVAAAWPRVVAVVVQPGVEFGESSLLPYQPEWAQALARFIEGMPGLVYEAHSTDYQTPAALRALVRDHFAILKVGPALTFALREGYFALEQVEAELAPRRPGAATSGLRAAIEAAMVADPRHWQGYYGGSPAEQAFARAFSLSDRARYYWGAPPVQAAVVCLRANLGDGPLPLPLLSQYLPVQYEAVRRGLLPNHPHALLLDKVQRVLDDYAYASRESRS